MKKQRILILGNSASGLYDFRNELLLSFLEKYEQLDDKAKEVFITKVKALIKDE